MSKGPCLIECLAFLRRLERRLTMRLAGDGSRDSGDTTLSYTEGSSMCDGDAYTLFRLRSTDGYSDLMSQYHALLA